MSGAPWTLGRPIRRAVLGLLLGLAFVPGPLRAETIDVVVTIKPVHSLVSQVMQGVAEPTLLVDGSASPHSF